MSTIITLTTDFGDRDGFVGTMRGVILAINPQAKLVDIGHHLPRQDVTAAALVLRNACLYYPEGCVHLAVIDPGVGTTRKAMIAVTDHGVYVVPDNGLLTLIHEETPIREAYSIENPEWMHATVSRTFHGRDIFAPAAAHLSLGASPSEAGPSIETPKLLPIPSATVYQSRIEGHVRYIDVYGNAITNIKNGDAEGLGDAKYLEISASDVQLIGLSQAYGDVPQGAPLFVQGSSGFVEIAVNGADASTLLNLPVGVHVHLRVRPAG